MPRPTVSESIRGSLPTVEFDLNKTMLGLGKTSAHTFKLPAPCVSDFLSTFNLTSDRLQSAIVLRIGDVAYAAEVRWARSNRSQPRVHEANAFPPRDHVFVQWTGKRFLATQSATHAEFTTEIAAFNRTGTMPPTRVCFEHLGGHEFVLRRCS